MELDSLVLQIATQVDRQNLPWAILLDVHRPFVFVNKPSVGTAKCVPTSSRGPENVTCSLRVWRMTMPDQHDKTSAPSNENSAERPFNPDGGEDESSAPDGGNDEHLHDDQKPLHQQSSGHADQVDEDDPHKAEKLARAGRDIDPDEGSD